MARLSEKDLWRQCVAWLTRCKVIPVGHKVSWPTTDLNLFARMLRDGVLLCKLVKFLEPSAMDHFDHRPYLDQSLCCKNIQAFLDACRQFGLVDEDMFDPMTLFNLTGFHNVLVFLSKLSRSSRAKRFHPTIDGFEYETSTDEPSKTDSNLDAYKYLHLHPHDMWDQTSEDVISKQSHEEYYQKLCGLSKNPQLDDATSRLLEPRDYIIRELIDTETKYLTKLNKIRSKFIEPLQSMISEKMLNEIFPCIVTLSEIHTPFLERLHEATSSPPKRKLSHVFLNVYKQFAVYGEFCAKVTNAKRALGQLVAQNAAVRDLILLCQNNFEPGSDLYDILSEPFQRISKYHLLTDELVKVTPIHQHDFHGLKKAHEAMWDLMMYTGEVRADFDKLKDIDQLSTEIVNLQVHGGNDLRNYGRLLWQGDLSVRLNKEPKTECYAFVFEKLLLLVNSQNIFRSAINLADYRLESMDTHRTNELLLVRKSQSVTYTLCLKSESDCDQWTLTLQKALDTINPLGSRNNGHKFALTTFAEPTICQHCHRFLRGLVTQGYKCQTCGCALHKNCIMSSSVCKMQPSLLSAGDRKLEGFYWYAGPMTRDTAQASLIKRKVGTYLLRVRPQGALNAVYALSMKTDERTIKHMKILQLREGEKTLFYLSHRRHFRTIVEQVSYYERNDLAENFDGLNQTLQWPFKEMYATALYDFNPSEPNQLPLKAGSKVLVIGKEGDSKGWWRGKSLERIGFFPKAYVVEHKEGTETDIG